MQRIVSICPSNTEILWALGLGENIVGVDDYSDWPEAVHRLPRLGPDLQIDMDQLKSLQPDWVLASLSVPGMEKNIEALQQTDIPFMVLHAGGLEDIPQDFIQVARQAGMEKRGEELAEAFHTRLESIRSRIPRDRPSPRLYWEWWPKPVFTPAKENWLTDVSRVVGAINVFGEEEGQNVRTDWQSVAARQPDYTLAVWTGVPIERVRKEKITGRREWQGLPFAREDRVHILEEGWYCRPSHRILTGIEHLAHILYPDLFDPPDPDHPL
ncbi:cobalamin-binding protein [Kroppenstedtia eburnea]|uniref:Iron complex transport system substrate-binding protein n=1 Tax=Kroppenstedtia eburnea TaxID=714067 RepID=A0A1N7LEA0_9BACL|nr:cobalamin-binding protein [Kroppenstedtia eburnea]EGK07636.1 iron (Fe) ABC superfamily ATP binding cassette transporter, binding protein [Desmospora sp. 8437]QKI81388.1 cobalamin-binding protein [Kroppenstedtia eburnea]SIS72100.1 iron complex transport system substrate-binding protein [Kroppenstedtia eburnea]